MGVAGVNITIGANTEKFKSQMAKAQASVSKFGKSTVNLNRKLKKLGKGFTNVGKQLSMGLTAPIVAMGAVAVKAFEDQIVAERRLEDAVGGAAEALKKQAAELQKTTRFGDEATMAVQAQLATLGLTEKQILKLTPLVQDLSARTGKDLSKSAKEVTSALSTGATTLEKYGVELTSTNTLAENIDITIQGLTESVGGQAEVLAGEGMGSLIQMQNAMGDLMEQFGEIIAKGIEPFVTKIKELAERFQKLSPETKKMIVMIAGLAAAVGPLLIALGFLTSTVIPALITGFTLLMGPIGLAVAAIAAIGAAALITYKHLNRVQSAQSVLNDTMDDAARSVASEVAEIDKLITIAGSENLSREKRAAAVQKLQDKYPDYLKNLDLERIKSGKATIEIDKLKNSILKMAQARAIEAKIQQIEADKLELITSKGQSALTTFDKITGTIISAIPTIGKYAGVIHNVRTKTERVAESTKAYDEQINTLISSLAELEKQGVDITPDDPDAPDAPGADPDTEGIEKATFKYKELAHSIAKIPPLLKLNQQTEREANKLINEDIDAMLAKRDEMLAKQEETRAKAVAIGGAISGAFEAMGSKIVESYGNAETAGGKFIQGIAKTAIKLIAMALSTSIANSIAGATASGAATGPAAIIATPAFIATAIAGVLGAFAAIPAFAQGGVAFGETLGIIGEKSTRSNPEVIAPLDKLQGMLGGMGGKGGVTEFVLRGETLRAVTNKVADNRSFTVRE